MNEESKKKFYTRWWFWVLAVICLVIIINVTNYINLAKQASIQTTPNQTSASVQNSASITAIPNAESAGTVTIKGIAYKLTTVKELIQNYSTPGFAGNGSSVSMVAVKGTIVAIFPENTPKGGNYDVVVNTGDGFVVVMQGTIDPNTEGSNGFVPSDYSDGTKVIADGVFTGNFNNFTLKTFIDMQDPSTPILDPKLADLNLPANTPILIAGGTDGISTQ